jgi:hypothetical protein
MYLWVDLKSLEEAVSGSPLFEILQGYALADVVAVKEAPEWGEGYLKSSRLRSNIRIISEKATHAHINSKTLKYIPKTPSSRFQPPSLRFLLFLPFRPAFDPLCLVEALPSFSYTQIKNELQWLQQSIHD